MSYRVEFSPAAARQFRKLDPPVRQRIDPVRQRIDGVLALLAQDPHPPAARQFVGGDGGWRVRTGDYRIIYEITDAVLLVLVLAIGHRREVYRPR